MNNLSPRTRVVHFGQKKCSSKHPPETQIVIVNDKEDEVEVIKTDEKGDIKKEEPKTTEHLEKERKDTTVDISKMKLDDPVRFPEKSVECLDIPISNPIRIAPSMEKLSIDDPQSLFE